MKVFFSTSFALIAFAVNSVLCRLALRASTQTKDASREIDVTHFRMLRNIAKAAGASEAAVATLEIPSGSSKPPSTATFPAASVNTS